MFKRLEPMSRLSGQLMENAPAKKMMLKLMAPVSRAGLPEEISEAAAFLFFQLLPRYRDHSKIGKA